MRRLAVDLFLMAAIGVVLGLVAPFGSGGLPSAQRMLFWVCFLFAGYALFRPISAVASWVTEEARVPAWLAVILTALVASLPLACLIGFALGGMAITDFWFGARFLILYAQVALVGIGIHLLMLFLFRRPMEQSPETGERLPVAPLGAPAPAASFLDRLPPGLGRDLLCLEMQDHYVRAETAQGSTLLLMRFRDAVAELEGVGIQVHRSWWVAADAVEALEREGRSARLRLRGGTLVPVSRVHLPAAEALLQAARSRV